MKRQGTDSEKMCIHHISDGPVFKVYKEHLQCNVKKIVKFFPVKLKKTKTGKR